MADETKPAEPQTAIAKPNPSAIAVGSRGLVPTNLNELWQFASIVEASGFAPSGMNRNGIFISIQTGLEIGLSPMQAMQCTAVINGRPSIYGDAAKGLVEASGLLESYQQWYECDGKKLTTEEGHVRNPHGAELQNDSLTCYVLSKRVRREPLVTSFSVADARAAGLWGKATWKQYPARMLMWRARGFNLRDNFGDVLKGLRTVEEVLDEPVEVFDVTPEPSAKPDTLADKLKKRAKSVEANGAGSGEHKPPSEPITDSPAEEEQPAPGDDAPQDSDVILITPEQIKALEKLAAQQGTLHKWRKYLQELYGLAKPDASLLTGEQAQQEQERLEACLSGA